MIQIFPVQILHPVREILEASIDVYLARSVLYCHGLYHGHFKNFSKIKKWTPREFESTEIGQ